jgi:hypothetical protein
MTSEAFAGEMKHHFRHSCPRLQAHKSSERLITSWWDLGRTTHPHSAFFYATVLEGAIKNLGHRWPDHGSCGRREPARLLADFVVDAAETNLVIDDGHSCSFKCVGHIPVHSFQPMSCPTFVRAWWSRKSAFDSRVAEFSIS